MENYIVLYILTGCVFSTFFYHKGVTFYFGLLCFLFWPIILLLGILLFFIMGIIMGIKKALK